MKNCAVAEWGSCVRAIAMVPRAFLRPLLASLSTWGLSGLLLHVGGEAAALNHEIIDDAMEIWCRHRGRLQA